MRRTTNEKKRHQGRGGQRLAFSPLTVERMEDRRLMSVSLAGSVLTINGTPGDDTFPINDGVGTTIYVTDPATGRRAGIPASVVTRIVVNGLGGNDRLDAAGWTRTPVTLNGGAGDDVMVGGTRNDQLDGGDGNDRLYGGGGNDVLAGGNGNDLLEGHAGNDRLVGGGGSDNLYGGTGDDALFAVDGTADGVFGGAGIDYAEVDAIDRRDGTAEHVQVAQTTTRVISNQPRGFRGQAVVFRVLLRDAAGRPLANQPVQVSHRASNFGLYALATVRTDAQGKAQFVYRIPSDPNADNVHLVARFAGAAGLAASGVEQRVAIGAAATAGDWYLIDRTSAAPTRADTFYPRYYLNLPVNADLRAAFGATNYAAAEQHWLAAGVNEARQPNPFFDPQRYMARYPDLRAVFGATNWAAAAQHWVQYGIGEGRIGY